MEFPHHNFPRGILFWFPKYGTILTFTIKSGLGTHHCLNAIFVISF